MRNTAPTSEKSQGQSSPLAKYLRDNTEKDNKLLQQNMEFTEHQFEKETETVCHFMTEAKINVLL